MEELLGLTSVGGCGTGCLAVGLHLDVSVD
jgi:hypothetical protein